MLKNYQRACCLALVAPPVIICLRYPVVVGSWFDRVILDSTQKIIPALQICSSRQMWRECTGIHSNFTFEVQETDEDAWQVVHNLVPILLLEMVFQVKTCLASSMQSSTRQRFGRCCFAAMSIADLAMHFQERSWHDWPTWSCMAQAMLPFDSCHSLYGWSMLSIYVQRCVWWLWIRCDTNFWLESKFLDMGISVQVFNFLDKSLVSSWICCDWLLCIRRLQSFLSPLCLLTYMVKCLDWMCREWKSVRCNRWSSRVELLDTVSA